MTRKKVKLAWIVNDNARVAKLKKRRLTLLKKVSELTTLCGVHACVIIYSPDETEATVWPSHDVVQQHLARFQSKSELEKEKKMMNQETYLREKVMKAQEQLKNCQMRNKEVEMAHLMHQINRGKGLDELNLCELNGLTWLVEEKIKEIGKRIEFFQQVPFVPVGNPHHPYLHLPLKDTMVNEMGQIGSSKEYHGRDEKTPTNPLLWDQLFINMMNKNEPKSIGNSNIRSDIGLQYDSIVESVANDPGLPRHLFSGNLGRATDMGLPSMSFRHHGAGASDIGLSHGNSTGGGDVGPLWSDIGLGLHPFSGYKRSSSVESELGSLPFLQIGGSSSSTGSDFGLPFDAKTWSTDSSHRF